MKLKPLFLLLCTPVKVWLKKKGMEVNVRILLRQRIIHQLRPLIKTICYHVKFLGMLASRPQPKEEMVGVIEDLDKAGIRFVYFSPKNQNEPKLWLQMGLEVGWNSSVSLVKDFKDSGWTPDQWDTRLVT